MEDLQIELAVEKIVLYIGIPTACSHAFQNDITVYD
jgi:hypothetical protein